MRPRLLIILLVSLTLLSGGFKAWYVQIGDGRETVSNSPEDSRNKGVYVCSLAAVSSPQFKIEGHEIVISKAWIEHNFAFAHHHSYFRYIKILPGYHLCVALSNPGDFDFYLAGLVMSLESAPIKGFLPPRRPFPFSLENGEFTSRGLNLLVGDLNTDSPSLTVYISKRGEQPTAVTFQRSN